MASIVRRDPQDVGKVWKSLEDAAEDVFEVWSWTI